MERPRHQRVVLLPRELRVHVPWACSTFQSRSRGAFTAHKRRLRRLFLIRKRDLQTTMRALLRQLIGINYESHSILR